MSIASDMELLRHYDRQGSEEAFTELVQRHINLVYSTAWRHTGIAAQAEEITQAVFIILARKAAKLRPGTVLEGWLHETTRLIALRSQRGERRRQLREQEAYMQSTLQESDDASAWQQLAPMVDEALSGLGPKDRNAVMLRFFKDKSLREVAEALHVSEMAAQRRVHRAVEKLRRFFVKRGVAVTSSALTAAVSTHSMLTAPVALSKWVAVAAAAKGAGVSGSTLILVKGASQLATIGKTKTAALIAVALALAGGVTTVAVYKAPPVAIIRPSQDSSNRGGSITDRAGPRMIRNISFRFLLAEAYGFHVSRIILPQNAPQDRFDVMLPMRSHRAEALQKGIEKQLGYTARRENRATDLFVLRAKDPALAAAHLSKQGSKTAFTNGIGFVIYSNRPITHIAEYLEAYFLKPVIVEPASSGNYDLAFQWTKGASVKRALSEELAQAGLELVPTNLILPMLVVSPREERSGSIFSSLHHRSAVSPGDLAAFPSDTAALQGDVAALQGTWEGHETFDKTNYPASVVFSGTYMEYHDSDRPFEWYKATFSLREDTNPKQLIVVVTESSTPRFVGQTVNAIYQIKNGALTITAFAPGVNKVPALFDDSKAQHLVLKMDKF